jgi:hypothetical protein
MNKREEVEYELSVMELTYGSEWVEQKSLEQTSLLLSFVEDKYLDCLKDVYPNNHGTITLEFSDGILLVSVEVGFINFRFFTCTEKHAIMENHLDSALITKENIDTYLLPEFLKLK